MPSRFPAERKKALRKKVVAEVSSKGIPAKLAPIPMPALLAVRANPKTKVSFRERKESDAAEREAAFTLFPFLRERMRKNKHFRQ